MKLRKIFLLVAVLICVFGGGSRAYAIDFDVEGICDSVVVIRTNRSVGSGFAVFRKYHSFGSGSGSGLDRGPGR